MAPKRKLEAKSTDTQPYKHPHIEEEDQNDDDPEEYEEVEEEEDAEEEEDDDAEEEAEEEEEEEDDGDDVSDVNQTTGGEAFEQNDEPFQKLLEPLSKDQLINLLSSAAENHGDVANAILTVANKDPSHRKVFVHGLGWDTTTETLTNFFAQYGPIEDSKAVVDKATGKSKGYGFILFKTRAGARNALKEPQKKIGNRLTSCQLASLGPVPVGSAMGTAAAAPAPSQPVSEYTQRKIYVSNVSADLDPQKLLAFFSKHGEIEEGPLGIDKQTGKFKGFCLFVYKTIESAKKALEEPHKNFEGHVLHCRKAVDGQKLSKARNPQFHSAGAGHLMAPAAPVVQYNQGVAAAAAQALTPALGQALTALLANNLFGGLGTAGVGAGVNPAVQGGYGYGNQGVGGYGNQVGYQNQQTGQGGSGRSQHGAGHMGGIGPYKGP